MKHVIMLFLLLLPFKSYGQWEEARLSVTCGPLHEILNIVMGKNFNEYPYWTGNNKQDGVNVVMFVNERTQSWTLVHIEERSKLSCVIGVGEGYWVKEDKNNSY